MKRKVVKQGPTTLMVSLPTRWAKKYGVGKGDVVEVEEIERCLKISTDNVIESGPAELDTKDLNIRHVQKYLHAMYQMGHDEIRIMFEDPKMIPEMQAYISSVMIGYEVVDQQAHSLTVKSISQSIEEEFDPILRRAFLVTKQLGENALSIVRSKDYKKLRDVMVLEDTNDKLTNFCLRVLNKKGYSSYNKTSFIFCLIWQMEKVADEHRYICQYLIDNPELKLSNEAVAMYEKANALFNQFYELFYSYSKSGLSRFTLECDKAIKEIKLLQSESRGGQDVVIGHTYVMINYLNTMIGPLIGLHV